MKIFTILLFLNSTTLFSDEIDSRFEEEFKIMEQNSAEVITEEITVKDSAIKKESNKDEEIFFKFEEVRPRRVRSR